MLAGGGQGYNHVSIEARLEIGLAHGRPLEHFKFVRTHLNCSSLLIGRKFVVANDSVGSGFALVHGRRFGEDAAQRFQEAIHFAGAAVSAARLSSSSTSPARWESPNLRRTPRAFSRFGGRGMWMSGSRRVGGGFDGEAGHDATDRPATVYRAGLAVAFGEPPVCHVRLEDMVYPPPPAFGIGSLRGTRPNAASCSGTDVSTNRQ